MVTIQAKPVVYGGKQMRSKLEASWASLFDELGFRWEYEKHHFNGWLVDFSIRTNSGKWLYCEVKPANLTMLQDRPDFLDYETRFELLRDCDYEKAMANASKDVSVVMLGESPFYTQFDANQLCLGLFYGDPFDGDCETVIAPLFDSLALKHNGDVFGLSPCWGEWDDLINRNVGSRDFIYQGSRVELLVKKYFPFSNI